MLKYKQLEPILSRWGLHFSLKSRGRFQKDELINHTWLLGSAQKLPSCALASDRIRWDMIDYMRTQTGFRNRQRAEVDGRFYPNTARFSDITPNDFDGKDSRFLNFVIGYTEDMHNLDEIDYFEWL
ncbi:unnamed protein product, partial [marine sediment metagenome]